MFRLLFFFSDDLKSTVNPSCFSNCLKPQDPLQPAPSPVGEGWGEGILQIAAIFPNTLTAPIQALRLVALSLTLSHWREDGAAVRIKGSARKTGCAGCFLFFRRPEINGCKSKLLFKPPVTVKPAATRSLPRGGGLGRGHSPNFGNLSQHSTAPIQALRLVALSLALSHGREDGAAVGIKGFARKTNCSGCFFSFQTAYNQWQTQESRRPHVGCVRYARVLHFPSNPNPPRACLAAHTLPTGSKVV